MGSSLGCFGEDTNSNDTVCYVLVGIVGLALILLIVALTLLCCLCYYRKKRELRRRGEINQAQREAVDTGAGRERRQPQREQLETGTGEDVGRNRLASEVLNCTYASAESIVLDVTGSNGGDGAVERTRSVSEVQNYSYISVQKYDLAKTSSSMAGKGERGNYQEMKITESEQPYSTSFREWITITPHIVPKL